MSQSHLVSLYVLVFSVYLLCVCTHIQCNINTCFVYDITHVCCIHVTDCGFPSSVNAAKATTLVNLTSVFCLKGELEKARRTLQQVSRII